MLPLINNAWPMIQAFSCYALKMYAIYMYVGYILNYYNTCAVTKPVTIHKGNLLTTFFCIWQIQ